MRAFRPSLLLASIALFTAPFAPTQSGEVRGGTAVHVSDDANGTLFRVTRKRNTASFLSA